MSFGLSAAAIGGIAAGVGAVGGAIISSNGANSAAATQAAATQSQIGQQNYEFNTIQGLLAPYAAAGNTALGGYATAQSGYAGALGQYSNVLQQLNNLTGANGQNAQQSSLTGLTKNPLYTTAMQLGQQSILANASATGGLRGGNTIASLGFLPSQVLANTEQQQISNLGTSLNGTAGLLQGYGNQVSQYGNLLQVGENAAAGTGTAALSTGNNITSLIGQQGAINAGSTLATTNAMTGALNNFSSYLGTSGGSSALASLLASAGGVGGASGSENLGAAMTSTPDDLISGYGG
ncbi:hypothetical protein [Paraburkholderia sp. GAS82]|uniref:hypothetical protein n=1 Tax=Paraburkholderia sp. GAS82 TaxID=3035137 RepID=UPI003D1ED5B2